ncbi:DUF397 domain-containing protein [Streptomyces mirabilis]
MSRLNWQKSSFSGGPESNCLYLATAPEGLAALIQHLRPRPNS